MTVCTCTGGPPPHWMPRHEAVEDQEQNITQAIQNGFPVFLLTKFSLRAFLSYHISKSQENRRFVWLYFCAMVHCLVYAERSAHKKKLQYKPCNVNVHSRPIKRQRTDSR